MACPGGLGGNDHTTTHIVYGTVPAQYGYNLVVLGLLTVRQ